MFHFHKLKVVDVREESVDTVSIAFEVPSDLKENYEYKSGQYLTIRFDVNGKDERRAYSICSSSEMGEHMRIAVKRVVGGVISNYVNDNVKIGDMVDVMVPQGHFVIEPNGEENRYVAFAAGSGITPILSMVKSILVKEPKSKFVLYYGNKTKDSTIFKKELDALVSEKFEYFNILTREDSGNELTNGRITEQKTLDLLKSDLDNLKAKGYYMCGPEIMISEVDKALLSLGVDESKIHYELFTTPTILVKEKVETEAPEFSGMAKVKVVYDDEDIEFELATNGENVLEAAMKHDVDAPFSCKGAVCCTCKAKVTSGKMMMDANYALSDEEVEEGFVLTCQAHPTTEHVTVDFDEA